MMTISPSEQEWCLDFPNIKWHTLPQVLSIVLLKTKSQTLHLKKAKKKKKNLFFFLGDGLKFVLQDKKERA